MSIVVIRVKVLSVAKVAEMLDVDPIRLQGRIEGLTQYLRHNGDDVKDFFIDLGKDGIGITRNGFYILANSTLDVRRITELAKLYSLFDKEINTEIYI